MAIQILVLEGAGANTRWVKYNAEGPFDAYRKSGSLVKIVISSKGLHTLNNKAGDNIYYTSAFTPSSDNEQLATVLSEMVIMENGRYVSHKTKQPVSRYGSNFYLTSLILPVVNTLGDDKLAIKSGIMGTTTFINVETGKSFLPNEVIPKSEVKYQSPPAEPKFPLVSEVDKTSPALDHNPKIVLPLSPLEAFKSLSEGAFVQTKAESDQFDIRWAYYKVKNLEALYSYSNLIKKENTLNKPEDFSLIEKRFNWMIAEIQSFISKLGAWQEELKSKATERATARDKRMMNYYIGKINGAAQVGEKITDLVQALTNAFKELYAEYEARLNEYLSKKNDAEAKALLSAAEKMNSEIDQMEAQKAQAIKSGDQVAIKILDQKISETEQKAQSLEKMAQAKKPTNILGIGLAVAAGIGAIVIASQGE